MRSEIETSEQNGTKRLKETIQAYTTGLYGCDIDAFAHFFSEIKLLWKLSPLFKEAETLLPHQKLNTRLSIIHQNALKLYNQTQLDMMATEEHVELSADAQFGLPTFEGHLKKVHSQIRLLEKFDFCVGCPPERILNKQKDLLKEIIKKMPYWKEYYQTDLLYSSWFFVLGLSKLREAGKLIYLTETYWPTEEGASQLRNTILKESKVLCIIDLGAISFERDSTPLPRYITLLEKCSSKEERDQNKIKIIKIHPQKNMHVAPFILGKILSKAKVVDQPGKLHTDEDLDIYYSGMNQGELGEAPWQQIYDTGFSHILKEILSFKTTLNYFCKITENNTPEKDQIALITPETSEKNNFRLFTEKPEKGNYFTLQLKPISKEAPHYIMALLNSKVLNFWYANTGSKKNGKKYFEPTALKMMPVRPIDFGKPMDESLHKEKISQIQSAIDKFDEKYLMANINLELTHGREEIVHDAIELMQKEVLTIEKNLKRYDMFFYDNISTLSVANLCPLYNPFSFREIYPPDKQCYLKDHKNVYINTDNVTQLEQFCLAHFKRQDGIKNEGEHLILISKDNRIIKIYAKRELLDFIEDNLKQQLHNFWDEILGAILLPEDLDAFHAFKEDVVAHCLKLKDKQIKLIRIMDELIFKLYGFNVDDKDEKKAKLAQKSIDIMNGGQYIPSTSQSLLEVPEQTVSIPLVVESHTKLESTPELSLGPPLVTADEQSATPPS